MDKGTLMDERFKDFNAEAAAEFLVSVAQAARTLLRHSTRDEDSIVTSVITEEKRFLALGVVLREHLSEPRKESKAAWRGSLASDAAGEDVELQQPAKQADEQPRQVIKRDRLRAPATVPLEPGPC